MYKPSGIDLTPKQDHFCPVYRMEFIKRNTDYALWSLSYMAGFPKGKVFGLGVLGQQRRVSSVFLRKIFRKVAKKNIVHSHRGCYGGFSLARKPSEISIRDVIEAVQGHMVLNKCLTGHYRCPKERTCGLRKCLGKIQKELIHQLNQLTLENLAVEQKE
ncbi:MAG: Rrf2 family transcriptional regulator [Deltaproteobacteria bacterium]|nr:Rrf2 family transcriptional regulator [Deltaproteobacteria bacterium]